MRAGDEAAARLLFDRHLPALRAKARARLPVALRGKVAESDVVQDAWLAAFLDVARFEDRGDGSFGKWLRGILEHKIRRAISRHLATAKRDARRERRMQTGSVDGFGAAPNQPSPSEGVMVGESAARVRAARATLSEDHQTVIALVHDEGLTLARVGERMGRSPDAARKLYARAVAELAARLGRGQEGGR